MKITTAEIKEVLEEVKNCQKNHEKYIFDNIVLKFKMDTISLQYSEMNKICRCLLQLIDEHLLMEE
jgi:hypothetical protein